jgi:hypothetical protein
LQAFSAQAIVAEVILNYKSTLSHTVIILISKRSNKNIFSVVIATPAE